MVFRTGLLTAHVTSLGFITISVHYYLEKKGAILGLSFSQRKNVFA